jgi:ribosome-binding protein aMBF1 (putative translation factor)
MSEKDPPSPEAVAIGQRIRRARLEAGDMKQVELAELMQVSDRSIQSWEKGEVVPWSWIPKLAEVLNRRQGYFYGHEEDESHKNDDETLALLKENNQMLTEILRLLKPV